MEKGKTIRENVEWLLNQYKKELEITKQKDQESLECEDVSQIIWDYENIITELEYLLKISK